MNMQQDYINFPEYPLERRYKLAYNWIPDRIDNLLDAGCAWGYGTRFFKQKSKNVYGLDPNPEFVNIANKRYPDISFVESGLEKTPFESEFFDAIVSCETLEHVQDEIRCLNEIFRILKPGGFVILTTPHKGLFGFMDPGNSIRWVEYFVKKNMSYLYKAAYKNIKGKFLENISYTKPVYDHDNTHRHYSKKDIVELLDCSQFKEKYEIVEAFRSGLFIEVFTMNLDFYIALFKNQTLKSTLLKPFMFLSKIDYWIPYNVLAYNMAIKIIKK